LEPLNLLLVSLAALLAGAINALAGGGSFLTLPALVFTGVPPVVANATGTAALLPGYLAAAWSYRRLIRVPVGLSLRILVLLGVLGGAFGASLLLVTTNAAFRVIVPWLLLIATVLFALGPWLQQALSRRAGAGRGIWAQASVLGVSVYGGYFNGGMGIVMLAMFQLLGVRDLVVANGLKNLLSAVLTLIAVLVYVAGGLIAWSAMLPMAVAAIAGGLLGARIGRIMPPALLRVVIVTAGALTTLWFFRAG
jgi:uncharacterized membrane protein YfcA